MAQLILLGVGIALCWGALKEILGCLIRFMMLGVGALMIVAALINLSSH